MDTYCLWNNIKPVFMEVQTNSHAGKSLGGEEMGMSSKENLAAPVSTLSNVCLLKFILRKSSAALLMDIQCTMTFSDALII